MLPKKQAHMGDRFLVYLLIFGMGWLTAEKNNRTELASVYAQVEAATDAVSLANQKLDSMTLCSPDADPLKPALKFADMNYSKEIHHES